MSRPPFKDKSTIERLQEYIAALTAWKNYNPADHCGLPRPKGEPRMEDYRLAGTAKIMAQNRRDQILK